MNGNQKFIAKLNKKEKDRVLNTIVLILAGNTSILDVKKLKGSDYFFRVRIGKKRIIYSEREGIRIITFVGTRDEKTYKSFKSLL